METFVFTAHRVDAGWALTSPALAGIEVTVGSLTGAHDRAREAVASATGARAEDIEVRIAPVLPARVAQHLENAKDLEDEIRERTQRAGRELAAAVHQLGDVGLSQREISVATGLPVYRVRQLADADVDEGAPLTARAVDFLRQGGALPRE